MAVLQPPASPQKDLVDTNVQNQLVAPPKPLINPQTTPPDGMTQFSGAPVNSVSTPPASPTADPTLPPVPPPVPTPAANPVTPMSATQSYGPDSNLIGSQINPTAPTATAQNTNYGTGQITAGASPQGDAQFQKYTGGYDNALNSISNGPNRTQLAMQTLQDFDTAGQPALADSFRRVGQSAAKFGRLGAGMTTNDLTGLQGTYDRNKMLLKNQLASSVAEGDINDRFRAADAFSNARNQQFGFGNTDRSYNTGVDQYNQGASFDRARAGNQDQSQWQDRLFGQNRTNANDLRGERDFQTGRSDKAQQDNINQRILEEQLMNQGFGRAQSQLSAGSQGNPASYLDDFANQQSGEANSLYGNAGQLLQQKQAAQPVTGGSSMLTDAMIQRLLGGQPSVYGAGAGAVSPGSTGYDPRVDG